VRDARPRGMALTDRTGSTRGGGPRKARELGIHLILGSEITIDDGSTLVLLARAGRGTPTSAACDRRPPPFGKGGEPGGWREVCAHAEG